MPFSLCFNSKTTFVTVNLKKTFLIQQIFSYSKTTFVTVNRLRKIASIMETENSKTTFVTVNLRISAVIKSTLKIQKQPLLLLITQSREKNFAHFRIQKQPLLLLIRF